MVKYYKKAYKKVSGFNEPICYRKNSTDLSSLKYVFYDKEYLLKPLSFEPKWIIDGGANAGYTSIYFANNYPNAQIVAIEPDQSNYEVLTENTKNYKNIVPIHSGLWSKNTYLEVVDVGLGEWGLVVRESEQSKPQSIKAVTIDSLMDKYKMQRIDLLKLNVEGAEKELFTNEGHKSWLNKINILIIELHDRIIPGCTEAFNEAVKPYNFNSFKRGSNLILYKEGSFK
jgi:FkbM family methyltransferase